MTISSNDNRRSEAHTIPADAHGQAAILLVESMMHGLIARSLVTVSDAVEMINVAVDVSRDMALEFDEVPARILGSTTLLEAMSKSLGHDIPPNAR